MVLNDMKKNFLFRTRVCIYVRLLIFNKLLIRVNEYAKIISSYSKKRDSSEVNLYINYHLSCKFYC